MDRGKLSTTRLLALLVGLTLLTACSEDDETLSLDMGTLQATTDDGTLQAKAIPNSYVGAVDDDLFIALALDNGSVRVYLCDGEHVSIWLNGEVDSEGPTQLGSFEEGAYVEFVIQDDTAIGTATVAGQRTTAPFAAHLADEEAGLYRAEDADQVAGWIVLDDGRQKGSRCFVFLGQRLCTSSSGGDRDMEFLSAFGEPRRTT